MEAHVFQENYTGVQMFVFHCVDSVQAKSKFASVVINSNNWTYLGKKTVIN